MNFVHSAVPQEGLDDGLNQAVLIEMTDYRCKLLQTTNSTDTKMAIFKMGGNQGFRSFKKWQD
jgi:hypothetical protein